MIKKKKLRVGSESLGLASQDGREMWSLALLKMDILKLQIT